MRVFCPGPGAAGFARGPGVAARAPGNPGGGGWLGRAEILANFVKKMEKMKNCCI